jgi:hypothetical protein
MTRVITALRSPINKTVSSRCDPKPGSLTGGRGSVLGWSTNRNSAGNVLLGSTRGSALQEFTFSRVEFTEFSSLANGGETFVGDLSGL